MDQWVSNNAAQPRINAVLLSGFAAVALLIATIGIYGVMAYSVTSAPERSDYEWRSARSLVGYCTSLLGKE